MSFRNPLDQEGSATERGGTAGSSAFSGGGEQPQNHQRAPQGDWGAAAQAIDDTPPDRGIQGHQIAEGSFTPRPVPPEPPPVTALRHRQELEAAQARAAAAGAEAQRAIVIGWLQALQVAAARLDGHIQLTAPDLFMLDLALDALRGKP